MNKLLFDQDSQEGFLTKPIDSVLPNITSIYLTAFQNNVYVASSTNYIGGEKLWDTMVVDNEFYYNVPITRHGMDMNILNECYHVNFEHMNGNLFDTVHGQPDNFMTYLRTNDIDTVYIIGNNDTGAILDTCRGLLKNKFKVVIVTDAINNITEYVDEIANENDNIRFLTTEETIGELCE